MKTLRLKIIVFLALLTSSPVFAEGVRISVDRDSMPAKPGEKATIQIDVDIPATGLPHPDFHVTIPEGKLKEGQITNGSFIHPFFHFVVPSVRGRAQSHVTVIYETDDNPAAGEILVTVHGGQHDMGGLGVGSAGSGYASFRVQKKIYLTSVPGSKLRPPAGKSPFSPTANAVNPTPEIINRLIPIAILLGGLGLLNHISSRGKPQPLPERPSKEKQPEPEPKAKSPFREPAKKEDDEKKKKKEKSPETGYRIFARLRPPEPITVPNGASGVQTYDCYGDGSDWVYLAVVVVPSTGGRAHFSGYNTPTRVATWSVPGNEYAKWREQQDEDAKWYGGNLPAGAAVQYFKLQVPWEWEDKEITLSPPATTFYLYPKGWDDAGMKKIGPVQPTFEAPNATVRILGANPKVSIDPDPLEVLADGWNSTQLEPALQLFYQPQPKEKAAIREVKAKIGATVLPSTNKHEERLKAKAQPGAAPKKTPHKKDEVKKDETLTWTPPFLVQERNFVDIADLEVTWDWVGGPMWERVDPDRRKQPISSEKCQVHLSGCAVETQPVTNFFWPLNGMPILASAWLVDGQGKAVGSPLFKKDPDSNEIRKGCHSDKVAFRCKLRDLSKGVPSAPNSCKLPPRSHLDVGSNVELKTFLDRTPVDQTLDLQVSEIGWLWTSNSAELPQLWFETGDGGGATPFVPPEATIRLRDYATKEGYEPIPDGPIFYTVIVEDGLGGKAEVTDACRVALGSIVLETGGPDFSIYEYRPYLVEAEYQPPLGYRPEIADQSVTLTWDFAVVNKDGNPVSAANPNSPIQTEGILGDKFHLIFGHTPATREEIYISRKTGDVCYKLPADPAGDDWWKVEPNERQQSLRLREKWHQLKANHEEEPALQWLPPPAAGKDWHDKFLSLAVRVEMRTKGAPGQLLATSDRLASNLPSNTPAVADGPKKPSGSGGKQPEKMLATVKTRTPPEFVWRDHRFKYVLLMLRLRLVDHIGNPYSNRHYHLSVKGIKPGGSVSETVDGWPGDTADHGLIEIRTDPAGDTAELILGDEGRDDSCTINLQLGALDDYDTDSGAKARLNNLGFCAGIQINEKNDEQFQRALQRFQTAYQRGLRSIENEPFADIRLAKEITDEPGFDGFTGFQLRCTGRLDGRTKLLLRELDKQFESHYENLPVFSPNQQTAATRASEGNSVKTEDCIPIVNPLCPLPPKPLAVREAAVAMHFPNTIRLPLDTNPAEPRWFTTLVDQQGNAMAKLKKSNGNQVTYLIDRPATMQAMETAIESATDPQKHFIYLLGWGLQWECNMGHTVISELLKKKADGIGIELRVMLWRNIQHYLRQQTRDDLIDNYNLPSPANEKQVQNINLFANGAAILDRLTPDPAGAHHQKILIVNGSVDESDRLIAFCGGIDIGNYYSQHDVHCRIEGPAAYQLLKVFVERWEDHPEHTRDGSVKCQLLQSQLKAIEEKINAFEDGIPSIEEVPARLSLREQKANLLARIAAYSDLLGKNLLNNWKSLPESALKSTRARQWVQIGRTYANGAKHPGKAADIGLSIEFIGGKEWTGYSFAPQGEQTAKQMILYAISQAKRFIYIEDQYLVNMEVSNALKAKLDTIKHLTILIPDSNSDFPQSGYRRLRFIANLLDKQSLTTEPKVRVFMWSGGHHTYVHSKTYIIDDEFAIIGSANCARRDFTFDTNAIAGICDEAREENSAYNFAHRLRIALWAEHLFDVQIFEMQKKGSPKEHEKAQLVFAELADGVASAVHWLEGKRPQEAHVAPYKVEDALSREKTDWDSLISEDQPFLKQQFWDYKADPDGS